MAYDALVTYLNDHLGGSNAAIQLTRSHPAATHSKSPISGTQDSSSIGLPCLRTQTSPRIFPFDFCISAFSSGKKRPIGRSVAARKLLVNSASRLDCSSITVSVKKSQCSR